MLEAARIDGASEARTFVSIVFPMVKPGVGALAIFTFVNTWNDYFLQLIMLQRREVLTISTGIARLQGEVSSDFGPHHGRRRAGRHPHRHRVPDVPEVLYPGHHHGALSRG